MDFRDRINQVIDADPDLTVRKVSLRAGSDSLLSKVLNPEKPGGIKSPGVETIEKIARALNVSPSWLAFGEQFGVSEDKLIEMAEAAAGEIQPGLSIAQIRSAVASALREQLALHLSVGEGQAETGEALSHGIAAQAPAPTKAAGKAGSRKP